MSVGPIGMVRDGRLWDPRRRTGHVPTIVAVAAPPDRSEPLRPGFGGVLEREALVGDGEVARREVPPRLGRGPHEGQVPVASEEHDPVAQVDVGRGWGW